MKGKPIVEIVIDDSVVQLVQQAVVDFAIALLLVVGMLSILMILAVLWDIRDYLAEGVDLLVIAPFRKILGPPEIGLNATQKSWGYETFDLRNTR